MTNPVDSPRGSLAHVHKVREEVRALLKEHGLRATAPRIAVLVVLHEERRPMTHEQVMETLAQGVYDRASIWRILADMSDHGVLSRMDLGDRIWRYELRDACRTVTDDHPHFLCEDCGEVSCLPPLQVSAPDGALPAALRGADFRVRIMGRCSDCSVT